MSHDEIEHHAFVFIAGLHRSGTSVLHRCLRAHPQISGFQATGVPEDEGQHLQNVYTPARGLGGPGKFGFHPQAALTEASSQDIERDRARLFASWKPYWDLQRPVLMEKSPPNLIRMRFLQRLFPRSFFIVLMRDPRAVALATQKWSRTSLSSLMEHWLVCHELMEHDRPFIERMLVLRYEHFVSEPQQSLDRIYEFLGVASHLNCVPVRSESSTRYARLWSELASNASTSEEAAAVKRRYGRGAERFGYRL